MNTVKKIICLAAALSLVGCGNGKQSTSSTDNASSNASSVASTTQSGGETTPNPTGFVIPEAASYDTATQTYTVPFVEGENRYAVTFTLLGSIQNAWVSGTLTVQIWNSDGTQIQKMEQENLLLYYGLESFAPENFFWVKDLNFDGFMDIAYASTGDEQNKFFRGYLWDNEISVFRESNFVEISNPEVNEEKKQILGQQIMAPEKGDLTVWAYEDNTFLKQAELFWEPILGEEGIEKITDTRFTKGVGTVAFQTELRNDDNAQKFRSYFATATQWSDRFNADGFLEYYLNTAKAASSSAPAVTSKAPESSAPSVLTGRP